MCSVYESFGHPSDGLACALDEHAKSRGNYPAPAFRECYERLAHVVTTRGILASQPIIRVLQQSDETLATASDEPNATKNRPAANMAPSAMFQVVSPVFASPAYVQRSMTSPSMP